MTRTVGLLMLIGAIGLCLVGGVVLFVLAGSAGLSQGGAAVGGALLFVIAAPLAGVGIFTLVRSRGEAAEQAEAEAQRKILDMVKTRGQVSMSDVIIELQSGQPQVQDMLYRLVGLGVFSGYINWDAGILYSAEAGDLHAISECKHCGGQVKFAGKGVQQCPHCGTEYFLAR